MIQWDWDVSDVPKRHTAAEKLQLKFVTTFYYHCNCLKTMTKKHFVEEVRKRWGSSQITAKSVHVQMACTTTVNERTRVNAEHSMFDVIKCSVILNELILFPPSCLFVAFTFVECGRERETSQCDWYEHLIKFSFPSYYLYCVIVLNTRFDCLPAWRVCFSLQPILSANFFLTWTKKSAQTKEVFASFPGCHFIFFLFHEWYSVERWRKYARK